MSNTYDINEKNLLAIGMKPIKKNKVLWYYKDIPGIIPDHPPRKFFVFPEQEYGFSRFIIWVCGILDDGNKFLIIRAVVGIYDIEKVYIAITDKKIQEA